ncbi:MAG: folate-binding protein [Sphingomicrobium sp.]
MAQSTLTDRALLRLSGDDVRGFLQGLVTSDVAGPLPIWTALLTPQGKCMFDFMVWADGDDLLLDCEADAADDLAKRLSLYRLRRAITIARDDELAIHWSKDGSEGVDDPRLPAVGRRWIGAPGLQISQEDIYREHRLGLGVCEGRAELGDLLWLECNAAELSGVSFTKGCFVGQENTARMNWRSKINRRLFVVAGQVPGARACYPDLGLSVVHARLDAIPDGAILPDWLGPSLG